MRKLRTRRGLKRRIRTEGGRGWEGGKSPRHEVYDRSKRSSSYTGCFVHDTDLEVGGNEKTEKGESYTRVNKEMLGILGGTPEREG